MVDVLSGALIAPAHLAAITIMGSGRLGPTLTALLGLTAAWFGASAFVRARRRAGRSTTDSPGYRRTALLLGVPTVLLGLLFLVTADGGPGTGNGVVASAAGIVLGAVAIGLDRSAAAQQS